MTSPRAGETVKCASNTRAELRHQEARENWTAVAIIALVLLSGVGIIALVLQIPEHSATGWDERYVDERIHCGYWANRAAEYCYRINTWQETCHWVGDTAIPQGCWP